MSSRAQPSEPLFDLPDDASAAPAQEGPGGGSPPVEQLPLFEDAGLRTSPGALRDSVNSGAGGSERSASPGAAPQPEPTPEPDRAAGEQRRPWTQLPRATFDLETTGKDATECRIVTASLLLMEPDGAVSRQWEWLADPGIEIPGGAAAVHGITTDHAREHGRPAAQVVPEIVAAVTGLLEAGVPVMAFNASYDFTVLAAEAHRHGLPVPHAFPVLDPYIMHRHVRVRWRGKRTLVALAEHYGVALEAAHTSGADALAAEQLARILAQEFDELQLPAAELHDAQVRWSLEQAADFQAYLRGRRQDPSIVIDGSWPVRS